MRFEVCEFLPDEAAKIREEVFVREQGFQEEFDDIDGFAGHVVLYDNETAAATCRFFEDAKEKIYVIGRIAVLKPYRGKGLGACILQKAEEEIRKRGGEIISLHAQQRAAGFYEKQGYSSEEKTDFDEDCPHVWMVKKLNE